MRRIVVSPSNADDPQSAHVRTATVVNDRPWVTLMDRVRLLTLLMLMATSWILKWYLLFVFVSAITFYQMKSLQSMVSAQSVTAIRSLGLQIDTYHFSTRSSLALELFGVRVTGSPSLESLRSETPVRSRLLCRTTIINILINEAIERYQARFSLIVIVKGEIVELFDQLHIRYSDMRRTLAIMRRLCLDDSTIIEDAPHSELDNDDSAKR